MAQKKEMGSSTQIIERLEDNIIDFLEGFKSLPTYVSYIEVEVKEDYIDIITDGVLHHQIFFRNDNNCLDAAYGDGFAFGVKDLLFATDIFEHRDEIIKIYKEAIGE